jgi:hypothetical protein
MEYTIQELRAMHKLSKPEMKKAMDNINRLLQTEKMSTKTEHAIVCLMAACKSYDEVNDTLFEEIDRLNGMKKV